MPEFRRKGDWLWREHAQKAAIDRHTALAVGRQIALEKRIEARVAKGLKDGDLDAAIRETLPWLDEKIETPQMQALRDLVETSIRPALAAQGVRIVPWADVPATEQQRLASLGSQDATAAIAHRLQGLKQNVKWNGSKQCTDARGDARSFCNEYSSVAASLAREWHGNNAYRFGGGLAVCTVVFSGAVAAFFDVGIGQFVDLFGPVDAA